MLAVPSRMPADSSFSVTLLGSGSAGNCALVESAGTKLLLDAGLSARQTVARLTTLGVEPSQLAGVLLTHEHGDHAGGLEVMCRRWDLPIYTTRLTAEAMQHGGELATHKNWRYFQPGRVFALGDFEIDCFPVPHDATEPVGFVLHHRSGALALLTDLGHATKLVIERVREAHTLIIETNHDGPLLQQDTKRPWSVKQRILSRHGHLSNDAAAAVVRDLLDRGGCLQRALLGHLSRDCNRPDLAVNAVRVAAGEDLEIFCASQSEISPRFAISNYRPRPARGPSRVEDCWAEQLELI